MMMKPKDFILASGSVHRKALLSQIGYEPALVIPADIDETPLKKEKPTAYVKRMALEKALNVAIKNPNQVILASDTIVVVGAHIIQKAQNDEEQIKTMEMLSGKTHKVMTSVCVINKNGKAKVKVITTKIYLKRLSKKEINDYVASKNWVGCSGYNNNTIMEAYMKKIIGSYSGVVGLPLFETKNMLDGVLKI